MSQIEKFEKFKSEFNDFLLERIPKTNNVLHKAIRYSLENGGKRFRAYLLFIVYQKVGSMLQQPGAPAPKSQ